MTITTILRKVTLICCIALMAGSAWGQKASTLSTASGRVDLPAAQWQWTQESWRNDNRPYAQARAEIDQAIAHGTAPQTLADRYKVRAVQLYKSQPAPSSALLAVFRWGYAAWKVATSTRHRAERSRSLTGVYQALEATAFPNAYDPARLKFLIDYLKLPPYDPLRYAGARLVKLNGSDYDVKYAYTRIIVRTAAPEDVKEASLYAQQLVTMAPEKPNVYSLQGGVYLFSWHYLHNKADGDKAVAAFQTFLRLTPPDDEERPEIEKWINHIKEEQKKEG